MVPNIGRDYVWRRSKEGHNPECLVPTVKHGRGYVMIWAAVSWYSAGPIITLNGRITTSNYVDILGNRCILRFGCCLLTMLQFSKMTIRPHTARSVRSWFEEHWDAFQHLPWPAQWPDSNIIEPLWLVLASRVRSRSHPPSSLKQQDVLHEE